MQYHLNGFRAGDPRQATRPEPAHAPALPASTDVLIVGCGPAGLTLATQLAAFPDIKTCIIDAKSGPLQMGQADGIACRSVEMFEAFGFAERLLREAYWVNETTFWKPDPSGPDSITRSDRIQDTEDGLSEFPHLILSQARVHDFYLETMANSPTGLTPYYGCKVVDLQIDPTARHPATVTVASTLPDGGTRTIKACYVVGCDGARSTIRAAMGQSLKGDAANQAWGVMDVLVRTDFPDIRLKSIIHSAREGSLLIIPREGGYLVRMYIEMDKLRPDERVSARNITVDRLIDAAARILSPYTLDVKEVAWWSVYEIGQRLADRFDDVPDGSEQPPHVFIAGDAGHTHSPKAGQGMNMSMADAFNLGWKLAAVLRGQSAPDLLHSYTAERQGVARELIEFDRELAKLFSTRPDDTGPKTDPATFQRYFQKHGRFTAGTSIRYAPSVLTATGRHQPLARGFGIGTRFHSAPVIRLADARPLHLGHMFKADGRWRLLAFADAQGTRLSALCAALALGELPLLRYTPKGADADAVIDLRAVYQQPHRHMDLNSLPPLLLPQKGRYGLTDYEKVFCADPQADIFDLREVDRTAGALLVIRPDQFIGTVLPLDDFAGLSAYFSGVLRPCS